MFSYVEPQKEQLKSEQINKNSRKINLIKDRLKRGCDIYKQYTESQAKLLLVEVNKQGLLCWSNSQKLVHLKADERFIIGSKLKFFIFRPIKEEGELKYLL